MLPLAVQVADPFHVVKLAGTALDEVRRRVQNETCGHRGRRDDPLWRVRRRLSIAAERLTVDPARTTGRPAARWDPRQESGWRNARKSFVRHTPTATPTRRPGLLRSSATSLMSRCPSRSAASDGPSRSGLHRSPHGTGRTSRTVQPRASTTSPSASSSVAFGLVNFRHHRVRCLLYAGKPDWALLNTIQP